MVKKLSAEFIGTLWLVLGGCGSAVLAAAFPNVGIGLLGVSLAFGLTILTMAYAVGTYFRGTFQSGGNRRTVGWKEISRVRDFAVYCRASYRSNCWSRNFICHRQRKSRIQHGGRICF